MEPEQQCNTKNWLYARGNFVLFGKKPASLSRENYRLILLTNVWQQLLSNAGIHKCWHSKILKESHSKTINIQKAMAKYNS